MKGKYFYRATLQLDEPLFYVGHKRERQRIVERRYLARWIDRIEPVGDFECMCVTVDAEDGLYLANDFIVTHNTAVIAWIILWFMSTREFPQIVVTASTQTQLSSKTWRELAKWRTVRNLAGE